MAKSWKVFAFKLGQIFGCGATAFIAVWLVAHPEFERNAFIRWFEIIGSTIAMLILGMDFLDISPGED